MKLASMLEADVVEFDCSENILIQNRPFILVTVRDVSDGQGNVRTMVINDLLISIE